MELGNATVVTVLLALLGTIFAHDAQEWIRWLQRRLLRLAVKRLPKTKQNRYQEEWAAHLDEIPGDLGKLLFAFGLNIAADRISSITPPLERLLALACAIFITPAVLPVLFTLRLFTRGPLIVRRGEFLVFNSSSNPFTRFLQVTGFVFIPTLLEVIGGRITLELTTIRGLKRAAAWLMCRP